MSNNPRPPKGMRDFLPADMLRRQYVINIISRLFETYGYEPLQTPVMELSQTLLGKYGEDAEKLIYYAQHPHSEEQLALRYDLTVPLARAFGSNEAKLSLPFKRYQIAPVWRAERPQRGRFREFFQCDADTVGVATMEADAECLALMIDAIATLGFRDFLVKVNNRKLLTGIGLYAGLEGEPLANLYRAIDKADKIGLDGVGRDLREGGLTEATVNKITTMLGTRATGQTGFAAARTTLATLQAQLGQIAIAAEGLAELGEVVSLLEAMAVPETYFDLDFTVVRGLGYYTGTIFEAVLTSADPEERVGSIAGGGRYDDLLGLFRKTSLPTVGLSLGLERLIAIMETRQMYPPQLNRTVVQVLVTVFNDTCKPQSLSFVSALRKAGIRTEIFMGGGKLGNQLKYADRKNISLVVIIGDEEIKNNVIKVKSLFAANGERNAQPQEQELALGNAVEVISALLNNNR
jgi:histidyl-tRNA synthetase